MAGSYRGSRRGDVRAVDGETGREFLVATRVTVDESWVVTVVGMDQRDLDRDPAMVRSRDRQVIYYVGRVEAAMRAKAWGDRPIVPDPKPKDRRRRRRTG